MFDKKIEWLLRIGVAGEFLGHGLLSIGGKKDFVGFITKMIHTSDDTSKSLLLLIGLLDVLVAILVLVKPMKPVLLWATFWGFWTALVRPLVSADVGSVFSLSSPWLDFIERFANWAAPLALYYFYKSKNQ